MKPEEGREVNTGPVGNGEIDVINANAYIC